MCGICGFTGDGGLETLDRMVATLDHRGPDESGTFAEGDTRLGVARLAIIDRAGAHQPLANEDRTITVVFNGEIFNYLDLRAELEAKGHRFHTAGDGETIVHAYEEYGPAFGHRLNGMFAIAIWDTRTRSILLVRDRYGEKPLFYSVRNGRLVFASEIKSILKHPGVSRELDDAALSHYFGLRHIPAPFTVYRDIRSLPPGHVLVWSNGEARVEPWYRLPTETRWTDGDEEELTDRIDALLRDSVKLRLQSEVGYGAYLSGGIDSSTIVAMMTELAPSPVKTFTLRFADDPAHKRDPQYAKLVAERYRTEHHECVMAASDLARELPDVLRHLDQPFAGVISSFWLSRFMKQYVTVALSGDGADDTFGSYGHHRLVWPIAAVREAMRTGQDLDRVDYGFFTDRPEFVRTLAKQDVWQWRLAYAAFTEYEKTLLWSGATRTRLARHSTAGFLRSIYEDSDAGDDLNRLLALDIRTLLPGEILYFNDMLSMAHSLEVRAPFLDWRLVELAASIPGTLKIRDRSLKYILRKVAARYVPAEILERPKEGFVLPANTWMRAALVPLLDQTLSEEKLRKHGMFNPAYVASLRERFAAGDDTLTFKVWTLVVFQLWFDEQQATSVAA